MLRDVGMMAFGGAMGETRKCSFTYKCNSDMESPFCVGEEVTTVSLRSDGKRAPAPNSTRNTRAPAPHEVC